MFFFPEKLILKGVRHRPENTVAFVIHMYSNNTCLSDVHGDYLSDLNKIKKQLLQTLIFFQLYNCDCLSQARRSLTAAAMCLSTGHLS